MAASTSPQSSAYRQIGPILSNDQHRGMHPYRLTRPNVGRNPTAPQRAAGKIMLPIVSVQSKSRPIPPSSRSQAPTTTPRRPDAGSRECATCRNLRFYRQGAWQFTNDPADAACTKGSTVNGWNSGNGYITMTQRGMSQPENLTMATVIHEIGHNWDSPSENSTVDDFRAMSGWAPIRTMVYSGRAGGYYVRFNMSLDPGGDTGDNWGFDSGKTDFVREYGKENPLEAFATAFAAYFMDGAGSGNPSAAPDKMNYMHDFVDSMK